jgi:uncharacterized membrane protein
VTRATATGVIAIWMLLGGTLHLVTPETFFPIVPEPLPAYFVVYASGVVELAIGVGVLVPRTRAFAGLAFAVLCAGFLPLHVWDFFRADPIFPVPYWASLRIIVQLALIGMGLYLWRGARRA